MQQSVAEYQSSNEASQPKRRANANNDSNVLCQSVHDNDDDDGGWMLAVGC